MCYFTRTLRHHGMYKLVRRLDKSTLSLRFKKFGKIQLGSLCRWALFIALAFGFKLHLIFHRVRFKKRFNILFGGFSS